MMPVRLAVESLPRQRWKNGAGWTRELAVEPVGAIGGTFDWRLSIADVDGDAPFSAFPGVDRCILLLEGAGIRLAGGAHDHDLCHVLEPWRFDGETPLAATLHGGACRDFNVMTRRGAWHAEVATVRRGDELAPADAALLLAAAGRWTVEAGGTDHDVVQALGAGEALLWRRACGALWATPEGGTDAVLLHVRLLRQARLADERRAAAAGAAREAGT